ncbi:hypothetical protein BVC71_04190 [Marivivens niveibacter]|uniref:Uncharacterized protein n=1 Tax=Marivivens niveibacter TaxID=1930667 RepID=A0A251X253_9RHOB|nr:hypothetical protein [Marivivens niveibacter]OUD10692.1 hypothetical protein BVC71_04190 [Marivivens niveibacter]
MTAKVLDFTAKRPGNDFWNAQLEMRLGRIESVVSRVRLQIWILIGSCAAMTVMDGLRIMYEGSI